MLNLSKAQILQYSENKTRIVIAGAQKANLLTKITLHVLGFHGKNTDIFFENQVITSDDHDFSIIFGEEKMDAAEFLSLQPTIAVFSEIAFQDSLENYRKFLNEITSGGVLVYNSELPQLVELVETSEKYFRKLPVKTPEFKKINQTFFIKTSVGEIPVSITEEENLVQIEGAKLLCQQLGIMEDEFYEALINF